MIVDGKRLNVNLKLACSLVLFLCRKQCVNGLFFLLFSCWLNVSFVCAQTQQFSIESKEFGLKDGLKNIPYKQCFKDNAGYYWLTSILGEIYRYNGSTFDYVYQTDTELNRDKWMEVKQDTEGLFWISFLARNPLIDKAYAESVVIFDPVKKQEHLLANYLAHAPFTQSDIKLVEASTHGLIIVLKNGSLYQYFNKQFVKKGQLAFKDIYSQGICYHYQSDTYYWVRQGQAFSYNVATKQIDSLYTPKRVDYVKANNEELFFWTRVRQTEGFYCRGFFYKLSTKTLTDFPKGQSLGNRFLTLDQDGNWLFCIRGDVFVMSYKKELKTLFQIPKKQLFEDGRSILDACVKGGALWLFSHQYAKVVQMQHFPFTPYLNKPNDLQQNTSVRAILPYHKDSLLLATYKGVKKLSLQAKPTAKVSHIRGDYVYAICAKDSMVYMGLHGPSLLKEHINNKQYQAFQFSSDSETSDVIGLIPFIDQQNNVWVGTEAAGIGLVEKDSIRAGHIEALSRLNHTAIKAVQAYGDQFCLSTSEGVFFFDPEKRTLVDSFVFSPQKPIVNTYIQNQDSFWLMPANDDIYLWQTKTNKIDTIHIYEPLKGNSIHAILADKNGMFWMPSNNGLYRFDPKSGAVDRLSKEKNNLPTNEFNRLSYASLADGRIALGSIKGIIVFDPTQFYTYPKENKAKLLIYEVEEHRTNGTLIKHSIQDTSQMNIAYDPQEVRFSFTYQEPLPLDLQYYYRINATSEKHSWKKLEQSQLVLSGIRSGEHCLEIAVKQAGDQFFTAQTKFIYTVAYPFYLKTENLILELSLLVLLIYAIVKYRVYNLEKEQERLEKIIENRTLQIVKDKDIIEQQNTELRDLNQIKDKIFAVLGHEMKEPLMGVIGLSQQINYLINEQEFEYIKDISHQLDLYSWNTQDMLQNLLNWGELTLKERTPIQESFLVYPLLNELILSLKDRAAAKHLQINNEIAQKLQLTFDKEGLKLILRNLINNAIKFSEAGGCINISVQFAEKNCMVCVADQGRGMDATQIHRLNEAQFFTSTKGTAGEKGSGLGLKLCSIVAEQNNSHIHFSSITTGGTLVRLSIPYKQ